MQTLRIVSPERRWRAAFMALPAAWLGWRAAVDLGPLAGCLTGAGVMSLAIPIMRTRLVVADDGVTDRRAVRTVQVPWQRIAGFRIGRPGGPWGGFCVIATCLDGSEVDLLSTRAYTRTPSASHLDELHRISWTLEHWLTAHR